MAKLTLNDLVNLQNEASAVASINSNNAAIEAALEKTLSRDGTSPNMMGAELDMNSHRIYNLPEPTTDTEALRLIDFYELSGIAEGSVATAKDWATKTSGLVTDDYSSKAYAIGGTGVTNGAGAAKEWATKAHGSTVNGAEYSSKHYAVEASNSASASAISAASSANSAASAALVTGSLPRVSKTVLKALDTNSITVAYCTDSGSRDFWIWSTGNYSSQVTGDAAEVNYIKADAVATSSGAWVRQRSDLGLKTYSATSHIAGQRLLYRTQLFETVFEVVTDHVSNSNPFIDVIAGRLRVLSQVRGLCKAFTYPVGWTGRTVNVWLTEDGSITTEYDFDYAFRRAFMATNATTGVVGDKTYYVSQSGDDTTGDGHSLSTAFKTIGKAMGMTDVLTILVESSDTYYNWTAPGTKSINVIRCGDRNKFVRLFTPPPGGVFGSWSATGGYTNVYQLTSTFAIERPCSATVLDEYGVPLGYKEVSSVADVSATPFSFYYNSAAKTIYVNAEIGRAHV